ncbi:hypothetical protein PoB_005938500 [Plakobranchus ocellatus]|uniref:Uncharacterized protein n=1 Tax=Plakobranchus ocellatus TaxID=259542 RepID=A0AAV4CM37_9GAST|nr:hypothetical protein PoB_005938500 [Plakobranchus ocellatus]
MVTNPQRETCSSKVEGPPPSFCWQQRQLHELPPCKASLPRRVVGRGQGWFFVSCGGFKDSAPWLPARHGAQAGGHVARHPSAVSGLPWSYTPSRECGNSTGIDPSHIQRKMTSRLGSVGQRCPPVSGEGSGQGGILMNSTWEEKEVEDSRRRSRRGDSAGKEVGIKDKSQVEKEMPPCPEREAVHRRQPALVASYDPRQPRWNQFFPRPHTGES